MDDDGFFLAIFLFDMRDFDGVRKPGEGVLLKEAIAALTVGTSNESERPACDVTEE